MFSQSESPARVCKHVNESLGSVHCRDFLDHVELM
jgi:hypothetical protein